MSEGAQLRRNPGPAWGFAFLQFAERRVPWPLLRVFVGLGAGVAVACMPVQRRHSRDYLTIALGRPARWADIWRHFNAYALFLFLKVRTARGVAHRGRIDPDHAGDFEALMRTGEPAFFGIKPSLVLKGGMIALAQMGDPNASIPTPQPVHYREMFATRGSALAQTSLTFVSQLALDKRIPERYGLQKRVVAVRQCRDISKADMIHNAWRPSISVDPETYHVVADGQVLTCEPATVLPMAQRYFLF